ncbi:MAG: hypothetical protein JWN04_3519 [Myxococcaceae bacterium]|nr:hypothetical protein [Myxococcaceae bacterium]
MRRLLVLFVALFALALVSLGLVDSASARAPDTFEEAYVKPVLIESPMWLAFELKVGPYKPGLSHGSKQVFDQTFGSKSGWMLNLELDITLYHIPYVGQLNVGASWGWVNYSAKAFDDTGARSGETTSFTLYPLGALAVLRIDALARNTVIPLTFAGKVGPEWVRWKSDTGTRTDASGFNAGVRFGAQAAFELDYFDANTARRLDEDYGVNHTFLLFEYYESSTRGTGARTFQMGLGLQY